jgi:hypothetical protein
MGVGVEGVARDGRGVSLELEQARCSAVVGKDIHSKLDVTYDPRDVEGGRPSDRVTAGTVAPLHSHQVRLGAGLQPSGAKGRRIIPPRRQRIIGGDSTIGTARACLEDQEA